MCVCVWFIWDMTQLFVRHVSFISGAVRMCSLIRTGLFVCVCVWFIWDMTQLWVRHDSFTSGADVWHDSFIFVTGLVHMCDMTHSYVRHDLITCATWLIHIGCGSWVFANKNRFVCICICVCVCNSYEKGLNYTCDMTQSYVQYDSFISGAVRGCSPIRTGLFVYVYVCVCVIHMRKDSIIRATWLDHTCNTTHSYVRHDSCKCATRLILIGRISYVFAPRKTGVFVCVYVCVCVCVNDTWHYSCVMSISHVTRLIRTPKVSHVERLPRTTIYVLRDSTYESCHIWYRHVTYDIDIL